MSVATTFWLKHRNHAVIQFVGRWTEQLARAKHHMYIQVAQQRQKRFANLHRSKSGEQGDRCTTS